MTTINLDGNLLRAVALAAAKSDIRQYLNGVCVQVVGKQCTLVATDGNRMHLGRGPAVDASDLSIIVPPTVIQSATALGVPMNLDTRAKTLGGVAFEPIEGAYPNWRMAIPKITESGPLGCISLAYLADLSRAAKLLGVGRAQVAVVHSQVVEGAGAKSLVKFPARPDFLAVVMGGGPKEKDRDEPGWLEALESMPPAWVV